jgi:phosphohistidine phosphatase SixA
MARLLEMYFIRHGNTGPAANDPIRELTEKGIVQALARREALGNPDFDLVLSSTALRAKQTAVLVANVPMEQVIPVETLYLPINKADEAALEVLFAKLMYAPLRTYREADTTGILDRYASDNDATTLRYITETSAQRILITGHAVMLNVIVSEVIGGDTDLILDTALDEAGGFKVTTDFVNGMEVSVL